jgi:hypothetical protein
MNEKQQNKTNQVAELRILKEYVVNEHENLKG